MKPRTSQTTAGLLVIFSILILESWQSKKIEHRGGKIVNETAIVLPYDLKTTEESLLRTAGMRHSPKEGFPAGYFLVPGMGTFSLYPMDPLRQPLELEQINNKRLRPHNPSLERFVKAAPNSHGKCYVMLGASDMKWTSEYYVDGRPAPFSCSYLLELKPIGQSATSIEVFELRPFIEAGTVRTIGPSFGFVTLQDRRDVSPTTSDRLAVLNFLKGKIQGQSRTRPS
jgi:hypothetical protein